MAGDPAAFVFVGGRPALDLVATLGRRHATPVERLPDPDALARWLVAAGVLPGTPPADDADLARAHALRESVHALVRAAIEGAAPPAAAVGTVNAVAAGPDVAVALTRGVAEPVAASAAAGLAALARDAVRLLGGPLAARIRECAHPDCSLVFLDATRSGRRRWCSMARCGNLVKVSGYRARRGG